MTDIEHSRMMTVASFMPTDQQRQAVERALAQLATALEATYIALDLSHTAAATAEAARDPTAAAVIQRWQAHDLVLHQIVENLYHEGRQTIATVKAAMALD